MTIKRRWIGAVLLGTVLLAGCAGATRGAKDRDAGVLARQLHQDLADSAPDGAVELRIWQSSAEVRAALTRLMEGGSPTIPRAVQPEALQRGLLIGWARALGGLDDAQIREALRLLRVQWFAESKAQAWLPRDGRASYAWLAARLADPAARQAELDALRSLAVPSPEAAASQLQLYADLAVQLEDPSALLEAERWLRERLPATAPADPMLYGVRAYAQVVAQVADSDVQADALARFRQRMVGAVDRTIAMRVQEAYLSVAAALTDPALARAERTALRELLMRPCEADWTTRFLRPHLSLAARQIEPAERTADLVLLRELMQRCVDPGVRSELAHGYRSVTESLSDPAVLQSEVDALRKLWTGEAHLRQAAELALSYTTLRRRQPESTGLVELARELRESLDRRFLPASASAYVLVITQLEDEAAQVQMAELLQARLSRSATSSDLLDAHIVMRKLAASMDPTAVAPQVAILRERLTSAHELGIDGGLGWALAESYRELVAHLSDPAMVAVEVAGWRERLAIEVDEDIDQQVLRAYAAAVAQLEDAEALRSAAQWLRERPLRDLAGRFEFSPPGVSRASDVDPERSRSPHARVLARLAEPEALLAELEALRVALLAEADPQIVHTLVQAYAAGARTAIVEQQQRGDRSALDAEVRQLLTLAGHPFLTRPEPLLSALEPVAGQRFGARVGAAVAWWRAEFDGDPARLRPGA